MKKQYRYVSIGNGLWARSRRIESLVEQYISASRPNARIRRAIRTHVLRVRPPDRRPVQGVREKFDERVNRPEDTPTDPKQGTVDANNQ
jgi:hypothetical protein